MERWDSGFQKVAIVIAYVLAIPAEATFGAIPAIPGYSYFGQRPVYLQFGIGVGSLIRPGLIQIMVIMISLDSIKRLLSALQIENSVAHESNSAFRT